MDRPSIASEQLVWDIYKTLGEQCQHFNNLESTYRTLASTWLLAVFGATGYIIKELSSRAPLLVAGVCTAGAVGIFLLALLDLMVYQRLLGATFSEQWELEERYAWIPPVAHGMLAAHGGRGILPKLVWYYVCGYLVVIALAAGGLAIGLSHRFGQVSGWFAGALFALAIGGGGATYMYRAAVAHVGHSG